MRPAISPLSLSPCCEVRNLKFSSLTPCLLLLPPAVHLSRVHCCVTSCYLHLACTAVLLMLANRHSLLDLFTTCCTCLLTTRCACHHLLATRWSLWHRVSPWGWVWDDILKLNEVGYMNGHKMRGLWLGLAKPTPTSTNCHPYTHNEWIIDYCICKTSLIN